MKEPVWDVKVVYSSASEAASANDRSPLNFSLVFGISRIIWFAETWVVSIYEGNPLNKVGPNYLLLELWSFSKLKFFRC